MTINNMGDMISSAIMEKYENKLKTLEEIKYNVEAYKLYLKMKRIYNNDIVSRDDYWDVINILANDMILSFLQKEEKIDLIQNLISLIIEEIERCLECQEYDLNYYLQNAIYDLRKNQNLLLEKLEETSSDYHIYLTGLKSICTKESLKEKIKECTFLSYNVNEAFLNMVEIRFEKIYYFIRDNLKDFLKIGGEKNE